MVEYRPSSPLQRRRRRSVSAEDDETDLSLLPPNTTTSERMDENRSCLTFRPFSPRKSNKSKKNNKNKNIEAMGLLKHSNSGKPSSAVWRPATKMHTEPNRVSPEAALPPPPPPSHHHKNNPKNLLEMPQPKNRSHRQRLIEERSRQPGIYEGEVEPAGYRGQEASFIQFAPGEDIIQTRDQVGQQPKIRTFHSPSSSPRASLIIPASESFDDRRHHHTTQNHDYGQGEGKGEETETEMEDEIDAAKPHANAVLKKQKEKPPSPPRSETKEEQTHSTRTKTTQSSSDNDFSIRESLSEEEESTQSSETFQEMLSDLIRIEKPAGPASPQTPPQASPRTSQPVSPTQTVLPPKPNVAAMAEAAHEHVQNGEFELALVIFGQLLSIYKKRHGDIHPTVASTYHNLGMVHSERAFSMEETSPQQEHAREQSLACFQAAARTARDSLGRNHPNVAVSLVKIGFLLLQSRRYEPALVTFQEALRIRQAHYGHNPNPLIANLCNNVGVCHLHLRQFQDARYWLDKALQVQRHVLRVERMQCTQDELRLRLLEVADTLTNLGGLGLEWLRQDGYEKRVLHDAEQHLAEAIEIRSTVLGNDHPGVKQVRQMHVMVRAYPRFDVIDERKQPASSRSIDLDFPDGDSNRPASMRADPTGVVAGDKGAALGRPLRLVRKALEDAPKSDSVTRTPRSESSLKGENNKHSFQSEGALVLIPNTPGNSRSGSSQGNESSAALSFILGDALVSEVELDSPSTPRSERTRIFMSPHFIPRQSPNSIKLSSSRQRAAVVCSSTSSSALASLSSYVMEETCMLNDSTDRLEGSNLNETARDAVNISALEIMVVRPCVSRSSSSLSVDESFTDSASGWSWKEDEDHLGVPNDRKGFSQMDAQEENDDGIAPLRQGTKQDSNKNVRLTQIMLEQPFLYLEEIYAAASRYLKRDRLPEALHLFQTVLECQRRHRGDLHEEVGAALHNVGLAHLRLDNIEAAKQHFERAAQVRKSSLGGDHPDVAVSLVKVGISLLLQHSFNMALQAFRDALSIRKRALGALHPSTARIYNNIGCVHVEFHETQEARRAFEAALDIQRNALCNEPESGPLMFGAATSLCNLGYLYRSRDEYDKAGLVLKEALMLQEAVLGFVHPTVLSTMDNLAEVLALSSDWAGALRFYNEILARFDSMGGVTSHHGERATVLYRMGRVHKQQNDPELELEKLQLALEALRSAGDKDRTEQLERHVLEDIRRVRDNSEATKESWI